VCIYVTPKVNEIYCFYLLKTFFKKIKRTTLTNKQYSCQDNYFSQTHHITHLAIINPNECVIFEPYV
jgi:hypothetical protein